MEMASLLGMLGLISAEDIKTHHIRDIEIYLFAIVGVAYHMLFHRIGILDLIGGMAVGVVVYGVSVFSDEAIGKGDALIFMLTGSFLGLKANALLVWLSSLLLAIFGVVMICLGKKKMKDHIPMAPFIFAAYVLMIVMNGGKLL
jgi:prepilin signal peptidase PulO-like enzyme (type II secretory pathway)